MLLITDNELGCVLASKRVNIARTYDIRTGPNSACNHFIVVVKKTFRYLNGFFYYHLYQPKCFYEKRYTLFFKNKLQNTAGR
jgi:hypothetical protein